MSSTMSFEHVPQDNNAFNPGDCVKVVLDDATTSFLRASHAAWLLDSHAGAGCYSVPSRRSSPDVGEEDYFAVMQRDVLPRLVAAGLAISPESSLQGRARTIQPPPSASLAPVAPGFVGVAPMLLHRHPKLVRYEGFEMSMRARARLLATFRVLGQHAVAQPGDGWTGCTSALRAGGRADVVAFFDP